ncbi:MAG TPA: TraB/GumN family protein [Rhodanobacter sp.]
MAMALSARRWRGLHGLLALCCAWLAAPSFAQSPAATAVRPAVSPSIGVPPSSTLAAAADDAFDWRAARGVLFRIRSPRAGAADSLLFGTIHIGAPAELGLDPQLVGNAVQARHTLVNEVDGDSPWQARYDRYRFLAPDQSLARLIGGTEFIELGTMLPEHNGVQLNRFKPWVAMTLLEEGQDAPATSAGTAGQRSIDTLVEDIARSHGLKLVHLETLEDQLAALDCTPAADYAVVLQQRLADPQELRAETERALAFYRGGDLPGWQADIDAMHGLDARAQGAERRARTCLIEQRNARWIEELEPLLRTGGCFVAVGAIHLTGKDGLLAGLARRGFAVSAQPW